MLTYFLCPDGNKRLISECLNKCPRQEGRCLALPTLHEVGYARPFYKPSVTQCLNPTRMEYLKITCAYAIKPADSAFALLGTRVHRRLENVAKLIEQVKAEQKVEDSDTVGTLDLLEPDELAPDCWKLVDTKTWGSYSVAKVTGRKDNGDSDLAKATLQLNGYRIKVESVGIKVSRLLIQAIIRDGGTRTARDNGVTEKMLMIPIERMPDEDVRGYFKKKADALLLALETKQLPPMCSYEENWANRRCRSYCDAVPFCPEGAMMARINYEGANIQ